MAAAPFDTSMAEQIIRNKLVWMMPAKYALLTTKRQAAADESNKQEQLHFSPIQKTFITFKQALYNYNYMG